MTLTENKIKAILAQLERLDRQLDRHMDFRAVQANLALQNKLMHQLAQLTKESTK